MESLKNIADRPSVEIVFDQDFIVVYRGLDKELCRSIIDFFDGDNGKWPGKIIGSKKTAVYEQNSKNSWDLEILNEGRGENIFRRIHAQVEPCLSDYLSRSPILRSCNLQGTGYKIQMYPKSQGYFRWHADALGESSGDRVVSMVLYLNDVEKGGETEFFHQGIKIAPKAGHLVLFPAAWNFMHCGHVPESSDKYIISTFIKI